MSSTNYEGKLAPSLPLPELYHDLVPHEFIKCLKSPRRPVAPSWDAMLEDGGGCEGGWGVGVQERRRRMWRKLPRRWDLRRKSEPSRPSQDSALSQDQQGSQGEEGKSLQEDSIQMFALLGSREIWDKTLYKIFMVLIPFSLKRMTIETRTYE